MGVSRDIIKSKSLEMDGNVAPPLFAGEGPSTRWEILQPLYGSATACEEWYLTLGASPLYDLGCVCVTSLGKSLCPWAEEYIYF